MPRSKKRKTPVQNQVQFSRSVKKTGKWRGKESPTAYKRKSKRKSSDKMFNRIEYRPKYED